MLLEMKDKTCHYSWTKIPNLLSLPKCDEQSPYKAKKFEPCWLRLMNYCLPINDSKGSTSLRCLLSQVLGTSLRRCTNTLPICIRLDKSWKAVVINLFSRLRLSIRRCWEMILSIDRLSANTACDEYRNWRLKYVYYWPWMSTLYPRLRGCSELIQQYSPNQDALAVDELTTLRWHALNSWYANGELATKEPKASLTIMSKWIR